MEKYITDSQSMEKKGVFNKSRTKHFELTFECKGKKKEKSILVIGLNAASDSIDTVDTTTMFLLNHLIPMGYSTITICNLYADICKKLKPSEITDNRENMEYIQAVLKRGFDTILIGYGNTFTGNKLVTAQKHQLKEALKNYKNKVTDLVDEEGRYAYLHATHPLMAGRYFPNHWKLRPFDFTEKKEEKKTTVTKAVETEVSVTEEVQDETSNPSKNTESVASFEADKSLSGETENS